MAVPLPGYLDFRLLRTSARCRVYEATRERDAVRVVAKVYEVDDPVVEARIEQEFALVQNLTGEGVVRALGLERIANDLVLLFEHVDGINLEQYAGGRPLALDEFLAIAIAVSRTLAVIHEQRIVHRDIRPSNLLIWPGSSPRVFITGFGISDLLDNERRHLYEPDSLRGSLPYISPEQTGRSNRRVDFRSDLYSLGVSFYELLTGVRPFEGGTAAGLIHAHLTRRPRPLRALQPSLPMVLSAVVLRLLEKAPELRYQSARGLLADLERIAEARAAGQSDPEFPLGQYDRVGVLHLPMQLYGRDAQLATLERELDDAHALRQRRVVVVRGPAGLGKSALVRAFERELHERHVAVAIGAFEPPPRQIPYQGIAQALSGLVEQILTATDAVLERWRARVRTRLGELAPAAAELVPSLSLVLGELPPLPGVGLADDRNRLHRAIGRLLDALAERGPLVLVLDDLQWAGAASIELVRALLRPTRPTPGSVGSAGSLLLVLCVRTELDDEGGQLVARLLDELETGPTPPTTLELEPLRQAELEQMLAGMLGREPHELEGLAKLISARSENIPLFVHQLLLHLVDRDLLRVGESGWEWDEQVIAGSALPDDMRGVMTDKLARMPEGERELLQIAACIGARFDPGLLEAFVHAHGELLAKPVAVLDGLRRLTNEGLLLALADGYQFSHEHVRLGAQDSLAPARRKSIHAALGQHLFVRQRGREIDDEVFLVVDQLRAGMDDASDLHDLQPAELAKLAHQAGTRAMRVHAWSRARRYLEFARELIAPSVAALRLRERSDSVTLDMRALMLAVHSALAQVLASVGEAEAAQRAYDDLLSWPLGRLDRATIVARRLRLLTLQGRIGEAMADGLAFLAECGLELPERPTPPRVLAELVRAWWCYRDVGLAQLDALAPATDERAVAAILVIAALKGPAYIVRPRLFVVLTSVHARLLLAHGTHPSMPLALAHLAICELALGSTPRQLAQLERLCEAALELGARPWSASPVLARTAVLLFVWPSVRPFRTITRELEVTHQRSLDTGDLENSGYLAALGLALHLEDGSHLHDVLDLHARLAAADPAWGTLELAKVAELCRRFVLSLRASAEEAAEPNPPSFMTRSELEGLELSRVTHYACVVIEAFGRWLLGERERVAELIGSIDHDFERVLFGTWQVPRCALLGSLVAFDRAWAGREGPGSGRGEPEGGQRRYLGKRRAVLRRWARRCPANYGALALLFDAELASLRDRNGAAQDFYERAIAAAVEHGLHAIEALACERFAMHAQRRGHGTTTDGALRQAHLALHRWGARAAVRRFEGEYPHVFTDAPPVGERDTSAHRSGSEAISEVDNAAVLRILETIGADLRLEEVVVRVLRSACESAGADHGVLLLERDAGLGLVAEYGRTEPQSAELVEPAILLEALDERLPTSAVHFVRRSGRALLIDDITLDSRFAADPYVLATQVRSLICMPIDKHGQRVGALLLTNHLSSHAFTADRFGLLGVLTDQAAHALENAQLYEALQRSEARWRTLVAGLPDIITLIDERGRVEFINHIGPLAASGVKPEQLLGLPAITMSTPENHADHLRCLEAVLERGEHSEMEVEYNLPIGKFCYQIRFAPITIGGRVAKVISIGTDVSARRLAEQERAQLEAQLRQQQRLESVGTLASGVAHEINNPVQGIMNYAELITAQPEDTDQVREFAAEIGNESQRVATIVRNLLAFSRQEREQDPELVDVPHVIETTLALIRTILRKDQIELELELADALPQIRCRPQQIHQILMNLVTNARDAVNEAGGRKLVRLRAARLQRDGRAWVRISVQDSGAGIPDGIRRRIFDPFFTTKRNDRGTGLGLAVSHGIAVDHGGKIEVESEVGVGSIFHLELPAA